MRRATNVEFALLTDVGRARGHNEDACAADELAGVYVVCDGMGGAAGGEVASQMAARVFLDQSRQLGLQAAPEWRLTRAVLAANQAIYDESLRDGTLRGMGTTLVGLELDEDNGRAWTVHVGDSRCYRFRRDRLQMLTADHSYVDEQVRRGEITEEEAAVSPLRNVITRAVGSQPDVDVDVAVHATEPGDLFLLCSDGLNRELLDDEIEGILRGCSRDLQECARTLVQVANEHGGGDNITVVLLRLSPPAVRR